MPSVPLLSSVHPCTLLITTDILVRSGMLSLFDNNIIVNNLFYKNDLRQPFGNSLLNSVHPCTLFNDEFAPANSLLLIAPDISVRSEVTRS